MEFSSFDINHVTPSVIEADKQPVGALSAFFNIVKATVGVGVLTLPVAFSRAGIIQGLIYCLAIGFLGIYGVCLLMKNQMRVAKKVKLPYVSYGFMVKYTFGLGPSCFQKIKDYGEILVDLNIITFHVGLLTVSLVFIANTFSEIFELESGPTLNIFYTAIAMLPLSLMVCWASVTCISILGTVILAACFGGLFFYIFREDGKGFVGALNPLWFGSLQNGPLAAGMMLSGIQCVGVLLSLQESMHKPGSLLGKHGCGIYPVTMSIIVLLYSCFGVLGYLKYGDGLKQIISLNIPQNDNLAKLVNFGFALALATGLPLCMLPIMNSLLPHVRSSLKGSSIDSFNGFELLLRVIFHFISMGLGMLLPRVDVLTGLIGSLTTSILNIGLPALTDCLWLYGENSQKITYGMVFDLILVSVALFVFLFSSFSALSVSPTG